MRSNSSTFKQKLSQPTILGIKTWVLILVSVALLFILLILILASICFIRNRKKSSKSQFPMPKSMISRHNHTTRQRTSSMDMRLLSGNISEIEHNGGVFLPGPLFNGARSTTRYSNASDSIIKDTIWRGNGFSLKEIELATNGFKEENIIHNGDLGVVYHGVLFDNAEVAVKMLGSNSLQVQQFVEEVEAIGHVKHKNLVRLIGYCIDGPHRILVYEYVDRNLYMWLHSYPGQVRALSWSVRVKIIQGIAKGLAYLHEDVEPKVLHRSLISRNILLDDQWNPKMANFGVANLFSPEFGHIIMESLGYEAPEYGSTSAFTEKNEVYSFGILVMEIISGRKPVDFHQSQPYLIEWVKNMVACQNAASVIDPKLTELPSSKELKRILLIALRCVDPDIEHRPKMGDVLHMLEPIDLLLTDNFRNQRSETWFDHAEDNHPQ